MKTFTGDEFAKNLKTGDIQQWTVLVGMAKAVEDDVNAIMFSPGSSCSTWIEIPTDAIEKIEFISIIPCKEHQHPLINLYLKEPDQKSDAKLYYRLLSTVATEGSKGHSKSKTLSPRCRTYLGRCVGRCGDGLQVSTSGFGDSCSSAWSDCFSTLSSQCFQHGGLSSQRGTDCECWVDSIL
jgi:hypothetical protein